jgi:hypothetical protein
VGEVAEKVGCSRQHVWRLMRKSAFLGRALAEAEYEVGREADGRLAALRPAVADALKREIDAGNVRVLLWLADRLGLGAAGYTEPGEDQPDPVPPEVRKELMTLRRDLEWHRGELDRRDKLEDMELAAKWGDEPDVA